MAHKFRIIAVGCLVSAIFISTPFSWALMKALSTEDLVKRSEYIIQGVVTHVESKWSSDGKTIVTLTQIEPSDFLKGSLSQKTIIVETPGGEVGDIGLRVSDSATFVEGEEVVLFLKSAKSSDSSVRADEAEAIEKSGVEPFVSQIVGGAQGKYIIDSAGMAVKGNFSVIEDNKNVEYKLPLEELLNKIRKFQNEE